MLIFALNEVMNWQLICSRTDLEQDNSCDKEQILILHSLVAIFRECQDKNCHKKLLCMIKTKSVFMRGVAANLSFILLMVPVGPGRLKGVGIEAMFKIRSRLLLATSSSVYIPGCANFLHCRMQFINRKFPVLLN